jgi:GNAT superfamily N-acetyltransferase
MDVDVRPCASADEVKQAIAPIANYFGRSAPDEELAERLTRVLPAERVYAAWEGGRTVGGLGAFPFQLTVPGGRVPAAGVTIAGVLPTHRRRGILRAMMRALIDAAHARGEPVAYLWATEGTIYGRFGFGLASFTAEIDLARERSAFHMPFSPFGRVRLVPLGTAEQLLAQSTNGRLSRRRACSRAARRGGRPVGLSIHNGCAKAMGICNAPSSNKRVVRRRTRSIG